MVWKNWCNKGDRREKGSKQGTSPRHLLLAQEKMVGCESISSCVAGPATDVALCAILLRALNVWVEVKSILGENGSEGVQSVCIRGHETLDSNDRFLHFWKISVKASVSSLLLPSLSM